MRKMENEKKKKNLTMKNYNIYSINSVINDIDYN